MVLIGIIGATEQPSLSIKITTGLVNWAAHHPWPEEEFDFHKDDVQEVKKQSEVDVLRQSTQHIHALGAGVRASPERLELGYGVATEAGESIAAIFKFKSSSGLPFDATTGKKAIPSGN